MAPNFPQVARFWLIETARRRRACNKHSHENIAGLYVANMSDTSCASTPIETPTPLVLPSNQFGETSHKVAHVLLAFGTAHHVQCVREVILPTGVQNIEEFHKSGQRMVRMLSELSEEHQRRFPLRRAKFIGIVYDESVRCATIFYTCCTDDRSRKIAMLDFDWLCGWCVRRQDLCDLCSVDD